MKASPRGIRRPEDAAELVLASEQSASACGATDATEVDVEVRRAAGASQACWSATTCAALPPGVPTGQSGPGLIAFAGLLMAYFRQSKRRTALFLEDLLGQPCCPALTVKMQNQVSQALAEPYGELNAALNDQPQVFMDESPTKEGAARAWLWTAVAPTFAVFVICLSRAATAIGQLFGEGFTGAIHCDRAKMYWQAGQLH